jgi:hypothetical protein
MKKIILLIMLVAVLSTSTTTAFAGTNGKAGKVTAKSIGAGALSLLAWPGIGQAVNEQKDEKVITHVVLGFTGIFRFWSCYDAAVNRKGGYWENRI